MIDTVTDRVIQLAGMPAPVPLRRHAPGEPLLPGPALFGGAPGGRLLKPAEAVARQAATVLRTPTEGDEPLAALVFDASGITSSGGLRALYDFFHPVIRKVAPSGRVVVLGTPPDACGSPAEAVAQRALEGFVRSLGKEVGKGATANLVHVEPGAEGAMASTLRFLLSARSAYVSAQGIRIAD